MELEEVPFHVLHRHRLRPAQLDVAEFPLHIERAHEMLDATQPRGIQDESRHYPSTSEPVRACWTETVCSVPESIVYPNVNG